MPAIDEPAVVIGIGEMGSVFARGFLRTGRTVTPVIRDTDLPSTARVLPEPAIVLVAVGEADLDPVLGAVPPTWRGRLCLLQNELVPRIWEHHGIENPTIAVVWFEKKRGMDTKVILSSPIGGPAADLVIEALATMDIPSHAVDAHAMIDELVVKNLYILTANIAGLETGGTVMELWNDHRALAATVADEILNIQETLIDQPVNREHALEALVAAFAADPDHATTGRSAPERLRRAIAHADAAGLPVPTLRRLAAGHLPGIPAAD